jgi:hypothetical protein
MIATRPVSNSNSGIATVSALGRDRFAVACGRLGDLFSVAFNMADFAVFLRKGALNHLVISKMVAGRAPSSQYRAALYIRLSLGGNWVLN